MAPQTSSGTNSDPFRTKGASTEPGSIQEPVKHGLENEPTLPSEDVFRQLREDLESLRGSVGTFKDWYLALTTRLEQVEQRSEALSRSLDRLLEWQKQQQDQETQNKQQVHALFEVENAQNLKILEDFWQGVNADTNYQWRIEIYYRGAYLYLPPWEHLLWQNQTPLLSLLDKQAVGRMYQLNRNLERILGLRQQLREVLETEEGKQLWGDLVQWKQDFLSDNPARRQKANQEKFVLNLRIIAFSVPLTTIWNNIAELYNAICREGNPMSV